MERIKRLLCWANNKGHPHFDQNELYQFLQDNKNSYFIVTFEKIDSDKAYKQYWLMKKYIIPKLRSELMNHGEILSIPETEQYIKDLLGLEKDLDKVSKTEMTRIIEHLSIKCITELNINLNI